MPWSPANEPWFVYLLQCDSVISSEPPNQLYSALVLFSSAGPCSSFFSVYSYGSHQRWVPASDHGLDLVHQSERSRLQSQLRSLHPVPAPVPEAVPEEPQGFRRYQTRMGPRAPSSIPQWRSWRARPSKRAPHIRPGRDILIQTSAVSDYISCRGDIITSVVACFQDSEAVIHREPHPGECTAPP